MPVKRIVIKIGTSTLTDGGDKLSLPRMVDLVRQISNLHSEGCQTLLVSSGAIAAGREVLGYPDLPKFVPAKQMLAAIGQPRLMAIYTQIFEMYDETVAQVLLTRSDLSNRLRYLNARNTIEALLAHGVIPIVNENDTVATEEIRVGDNDNLSAMLSNLIEADLLMMLTNQEGVFTADPIRNPDARLVREVSESKIPDSLWRAAGNANDGIGTGGMYTKLQAADLARRTGAEVIVTHGSLPNVITRLAAGESLGTRFHSLVTNMESRKRYILAGPEPAGKLTVDPGAASALINGKNSLLPVGVLAIEGKFARGETVIVADNSGEEIARGLANYSSESMARLCGRQSKEIESILGYSYGNELVHRENMILL